MPQIIGSIIKTYPTVTLQSKSGQTFTKRDIVISVRRYDPMTGQPSDYAETPLITFFNDRCALLDQFQPGQYVQISYELTGRRYTNASGEEFYATDVRGYRIEAYAGYRQQQPVQPVQQSAPVQQPSQMAAQQPPMQQSPMPHPGQSPVAAYLASQTPQPGVRQYQTQQQPQAQQQPQQTQSPITKGDDLPF